MSRSLIVISSILIYHAVFITLHIGRVERYLSVLCAFVVLCLLLKNNIRYVKKYPKINIAVFLFCISLAITSVKSLEFNVVSLRGFVASGISKVDYIPETVIYGLTLSFCIIVTFLFVEYVIYKNYIQILFDSFWKTSLFYVILIDVLILIDGVSINGSGYLIGNKFDVAYLHIFMSILYYVNFLYKKKSRKTCFYLFLLFSAIISNTIGCTTAVVGCIILFLLFQFKNLFQYIIYSPKLIILILMFIACFFFIFMSVLEYPIVKYIIVDILGEDMTLTGRTIVYGYLGEILLVTPLWGIGYDNSFALMSYLYGFPNSQNGIINVIIEQGFIGAMLFVYMLYTIFSYNRDCKDRCYSYPIMALLFIYIILSSIEITLNMYFVALLALSLAHSDLSKKTCNSKK